MYKTKTAKYTFKLLTVVFSSFFVLIAFFSTGSEAQANDYYYDKVDVNIQVNADSTVDITETLEYRFTGEYHAVFREITLEDRENRDACKSDPALQCGGFEYIDILSVKGDGDTLSELPESEYKYDDFGRLISPPDTFSATKVVAGGEDRLKIQWVFSEPGRSFDDEVLKFEIKYRVYGSIGYFPEEDYDLFYWNTISADRDKIINEVNLDITFPEDVDIEKQDFEVLGRGFDYYWKYNKDTYNLIVSSEELLPLEQYTVLLKIPRGVVDEYASLNLDLSPNKQDVTVDGVFLKDVSGRLSGIPAGNVSLKFSVDGYNSKEYEVTLIPGETQDLKVTLSPSPGRIAFWAGLILCNLFGFLLFPLFMFLVYRNWARKGKDLGRRKTIIPIYSPPDNMKPYLLGSVKDEKVDIVDITATLIDAAFKGYIKIREFDDNDKLFKSRDYEFIKQKSFDDLSETEQRILKDIFGTQSRVTVSSLKNKFYTKLPGIRDKVYEEMVTKGYFEKRPDKVRTNYIVKGVLLTVAGVLSIFGAIIIPFFVTASMSFFMAGVVYLMISSKMPAKTKEGGRVLDEILGFKMYMDTAEKHRVQNLTPETFEKYLSYAIIFGIEKKWAEKFKDIYTQQPDWYEGNISNWNSIYLANALSDFRSTTSSTMVSSPSSSGSGSSWTGGGWSGGGGFSGGFSGGGGGGGASGAW